MPAKGTCRGGTWWTKERVLEGLRRLHRETGQSPTNGRRFGALVGLTERGRAGAQRRYPSRYAVSRHYGSFEAAWRAAGVPAVSPNGVAPVSGVEGLRWARTHQAGERYGRLVVIGLAGYRLRGGARRALWLCRCDCGRERLVESGRLKWKRECEACARERRFNNLKPFAQGARPSSRRADART